MSVLAVAAAALLVAARGNTQALVPLFAIGVFVGFTLAPDRGREPYHRLVVLIPEMQALHQWRRILHNQRGFVLDRAIQEGTANVVICRLRFRPTAWSGPAAATYPDAAAQPQGSGQRAAADDGG